MRIGFVLFPSVTQLDFTGPLQLLERMPDTKTFLMSKSGDRLKTYDPQPPFDSGHPRTASQDVIEAIRPNYEAQIELTARAIESALKPEASERR